MDSIRDRFHSQLDDLRKLIDFFDTENKLLSKLKLTDDTPEILLLSSLSGKLKSFNTVKRTFNYNSIIISLYGYFEKFIEDLLVTYIDRLQSLNFKYKDLPDAIQKSHYKLSLTFLEKVEKTGYSGSITKEEIIKNLHTCINLNGDYQLNKDAYAQHSSNFRLQVIDESFSHIGVQKISDQTLKVHSFVNYIKEQYEIGLEGNVSIEQAYTILNDLAERRNDVAHGVPNEILSNEILLEYIKYFQFYSEALVQVLLSHFYKIEAEVKGDLLGQITNVFQDGNVVCIFSNKQSIKVDDELIGKNSSQVIKAKILSIKLDDNSITEVNNDQDYELGLLLDSKFKDNFQVYRLR